jgi:SWI/SNF-related matrix-associated actin-dependent regulator 1 of chromatin subfamily A
MNIEIIRDEKVRFKKLLFHEGEILLAKCFGFTVYSDTMEIEADISLTSKRSLYEFIRLAFRTFNESPLEEDKRNAFFGRLNEIYAKLFSFVDNEVAKTLPYHDKLYNHQWETFRESYYKKYNFLALDMGLGKTLISASLSRLHKCKRTVIICPAAVKWNWMRDLVKFGFNELYFTILDSRKSRTVKAFLERFVIINYDIVGNYAREISTGEVDHFILDESHMLKNHTSKRYKEVKKLMDMYPNARITFLSGTPVKNRVDDIFAYMKLIRHPLGDNYKKFLEEYTVKTIMRNKTRVTGGKNLQELFVKMSNFMIRKLKENCLDLPEKIFFNYKYSLDDYRDQYDAVIKELKERKDLTNLNGNLHTLNKITSAAKVPGIIELAENIIEQGKKVVIFSGYNEPIDRICGHFGDRCVKITGSVDSYTRDLNVQRFHNDEGCHVFVGNMIAAGVGLNLTNAQDVIFADFPFAPADLYQAIDRLHRIGQKSSVNVHYTFCEDSIDDYIYDIIIDKEKDINALIDKGKEVMTKDDFVEMLMSKLLKKDLNEA